MPSARPETRYAKSGDLNIAYQVVGDGPLDLVYVPGWISNVELNWDEPALAHVLERLASFSRLILFDKRGTGLSDPVPQDRLPTLEERMDDVRAVMDAVGRSGAAVFGFSEGGLMSVLFAATYPERTDGPRPLRRLRQAALEPATIRGRRSRTTASERSRSSSETGPSGWTSTSSRRARTTRSSERLATYLRRSASPGAAVALMRMNTQLDVRDVLPTIQAPTLVLHRADDRDASVEEGRWIAARIPGAKFVELPGDAHILWAGNTDAVVDEIEEFLTGVRRGARARPRARDRALHGHRRLDRAGDAGSATGAGATCSNDIMLSCAGSSSASAAARWTRPATASSPRSTARHVRSAAARRSSSGRRALGLEVRAGVHTGECELVGGKVAGSRCTRAPVSRAWRGRARCSSRRRSRTSSRARGSSSRTAATHELKGVPGEWRLYAAK